MNLSTNLNFDSALEKLGLDNKASNSVRFVVDRDDEDDPDIYLALESAKDFGAKAVYFRFYNDDRPPKPQIYIYDQSELVLAHITGSEIHHKLWNAGIVQFCFIFNESQTLVYNCAKKPQWDESGETFITAPHDIIELLSEVQGKLDSYNIRQFDSGLFWDSKVGKDFHYEEGAYEQLLSQLKNVKANIVSRFGKDNAGLAKKVLMILILIKYLEERKDEEGNGALNPHEFYKAYNSQNPTLEGILEHAETFASVLKELSSAEHFNGQIFNLSDEEYIVLKTKIDLTVFQYFVRGDVSIFSKGNQGIGQMSFWRLYQFNYLPIELISHIYEDFLSDENGQKKKGVVYTPPYLVQFLIDRCMPLRCGRQNFKIIDPACGSGIFLVGAFKRMIQWWRARNGWKKPQKENIEELQQILHSNIYGCDLEDEAVTLSYFSLGLALLDALSPKEIWRNVHFDNLIGTNLFQGDFFKTLKENLLTSDFQLVIGNPPFNSELTNWAANINKAEQLNLERPDLPDNQIALLFLEQSLALLSEGGSCCLILPSGPTLYNTNTHNFRKYIFDKCYVKSIYDFTSLRAKLFIGSSSSAKPAVISLIAEKNNFENKITSHYIFRRTKASSEKIDFEIDHYDIHRVSHKVATSNTSVWQANFMGGGRLHQLLQKVGRERTLGQYLDEMVEKNGWEVAEGWIESPTATPLQRIQTLRAKIRTKNEDEELLKLEEKHRAEWITGRNFVETDSFTESGIKSIKVCNAKYFYRTSKTNKKVFEPPHLLIKEQSGVSSIPIEFRDDYLTFRNEIIGIHAPDSDKEILRKIEKRYKNNASYSALLWLLSGRIITTREGVVLKNDILSLPFPEKDLRFDSIEKLLLSDISKYYSEFRKTGERSTVLSGIDTTMLETFGKYYCNVLNSVYENFRPLKPIIGQEFIAYPFVLGERPEIEIPSSIAEIETKLKSIIDTRLTHNLWVKKIVKVYQKNVIFLYKPNQKRYWLPSIAIRDADETFVDLYTQGK